MNRKRILTVFLISSLIFAGGVVVFESVHPKSAFFEAIGEVGKKIGKKISKGLGVTKAKRAFLTMKGLTTSFALMVAGFQKELISASYYDESVSVEVPLKLPTFEGDTSEEEEESEEEPATKERTIGLDYDFGFIGSGDINKEIKTIESIFIYKSPIKLGKRDEMPIYASRFLEAINKLVERYKAITSLLLGVLGEPLKVVLTGVQEMLKAIATLLRMQPEMVFKFKILKLLHSVQEGRDNLVYSDVPVHLIILLGRLANSVNVKASRKLLENRGIKREKDFRKRLYFKDTGIEWALKMKEVDTVFPLSKIIFEPKVISMPQWMITEHKERKKKKKITKMERLHSNVRLTRGHLTQSAYFLEVIIPWLDKLTLDKTDSELFVKSLRVHAARRYQGIMKLLGLGQAKAPDAVPEGDSPEGDAPEESEEEASTEDKTVLSQEMDKLAWVKAMIQDRWIALIDVLDKSHKAMLKKAFFTTNHRNKVASLLAQVKSEKEQLYKILADVTWNAKLPEGVNIDEIGLGKITLSDIKMPEKIFDDPFLEILGGDGLEGSEFSVDDDEGILLE